MSVDALLPPFVDHHVHLQLVDIARLDADAGIAGVVDLGGTPSVLAEIADARGGPYVRFAGAFLTAPGGYPSDRAWAPAGAVRELRSPADAAEAVAEQFEHGATAVKVTVNTTAGPVPSAEMLDAIILAAHARDLPVVAHVEGGGTAAVAVDAGVDVLAHTPWTERLDAGLLATAASQGQRWITTLDIHRHDPADHARAIDNLARFHDAGGGILYGTDLGNGDLPYGVNAGEIRAMVAAGLSEEAIVAALTDPWPAQLHPDGVATRVSGQGAPGARGIVERLASAQVVRRR